MRDFKPSGQVTEMRYTVTWTRHGLTRVAYRTIEKVARKFFKEVRDGGADRIVMEEHAPDGESRVVRRYPSEFVAPVRLTTMELSMLSARERHARSPAVNSQGGKEDGRG